MRDWLFEERKKQNLTQLQLAGRAGISRAYYTQLELMQRNPSIKIAKKLGIALHVDWTRFYEDSDSEAGN